MVATPPPFEGHSVASNPAVLDSVVSDLSEQMHPETISMSDFQQSRRTKVVKVLHVINGEHFSGAERVQDLLAQCLPASGYEVGFACVKPGAFDQARESDVPLFRVNMNSRFDVVAIRHLRQIVVEGDYQVLHAHTPRSLMLAAIVARWTGLPLIYHVHSPTSRDSTHKVRSLVNATVESVSMRSCTRLITVSSSLCEHVRRLGFDPKRISVVPNGVAISNVRRSASKPKGTWTLGTVALFRPRKGTEVLLDAMATLRAAGRDVRLRAVGPFETPDYEQQVMAHAERLGLQDHIDWVGFTRDVHAEFQKMDLFVLPSLFGEGLPMVVLEAMACGVPPIGTRVEGVPEAIRDGHNGLLAGPNDPGDLARVISRVLDDDVSWSRMRQNAIERHAAEFSDESMASKVAAVYDDLLGDTKP